MYFKTLLEKYEQLLFENNQLKEEIKRLRAQLGIEVASSQICEGLTQSEVLSNTQIVIKHIPAPEPELFDQQVETEPSKSDEAINKRSGPDEKVKLFMSMFRGRDDVYAKRWENKVKGTAGYSPSCINEWKPGICQKPKIKCTACKHQDFLPLSELTIDAHLRGQQNLVAGIYPLLPNETCWFLAIDFDDDGWQKDITTLEEVCSVFEIPNDKSLTLVATGRYIGVGFDEPRLDTLFLAMPISWKGTLQQYAGRLHRLFKTKKEALIYDYVDVRVRMFEKMYNKRLAGYASIGYKTKGENIAAESTDIIFDKTNFLPVYSNDIISASREILIVSPFVTKRRASQMMQNLRTALLKGVKVVVVTRTAEDFKDKDLTARQTALDFLRNSGVVVFFKSNIHQKFAVMDEKIVWYGSINLLSFGSAEESVMRLESSNIAGELIRSITRETNT